MWVRAKGMGWNMSCKINVKSESFDLCIFANRISNDFYVDLWVRKSNRIAGCFSPNHKIEKQLSLSLTTA